LVETVEVIAAYPPPTEERFRALARSSPWRWATLEFGWTDSFISNPRHAWVRRPNQVRVESADGTLDRVLVATRPFEGARHKLPNGKWGPALGVWAHDVAPTYDTDGFVQARPPRSDLNPAKSDVDYDVPMYGDYHWVAMLDPAEFADPDADETGSPVRLDDIRAVEHHGRPAWQAFAEPTPLYAPRCVCCPLLAGAWDVDWIPAGPSKVRLDLQTGICVYAEYLGDTGGHLDHDLRILRVDEPFDNALFDALPVRRWWRRFSWRRVP